MARGDLRWVVAVVISGALLILVSPPRYGDTTLLEDILGSPMSGAAELLVGGFGVALFVGFLACRRNPADPDDREWVPEE